MFVELNPGTQDGARWPTRASSCRSPTRCPTSTPTSSSPRSTPTRATTCSCSSRARPRACAGAADDLRDVLKRFEPTYRDLARVQPRRRLAPRRAAPARSTRSTWSTASWPATTTTSPSSWTAPAAGSARCAEQRQNVAATIHELPSTLQPGHEHAGQGRRAGRDPRPASDELRQIAGPLARNNRLTLPMALEAAPLLRDDIRPFVREAAPAGRELGPPRGGWCAPSPA